LRNFCFEQILKTIYAFLIIMKYLIVGLGNVGAAYDFTRHNIGFEVLDYLVREAGGAWALDRHAYVCELKIKGKIFFCIKPTTYMNLSGQALRYWLQKEKIELENALVILDDLNLPLGQMRIRAKGSSGGHNGLKNIEELLQTVNYPRVRIGIGDDFKEGRQVDFVLGKWTADETEKVNVIVQQAAEAIQSFGFIGLERTMNIFNAKKL
jgi:peptidyl-tRNA hydrolase, PTH1 family